MAKIKRKIENTIPKLTKVFVYRDVFGSWFMSVTYEYSDEKGKHECTFPKVKFPLNEKRVPDIVSNHNGTFIEADEVINGVLQAFSSVVVDPRNGEEYTSSVVDILVEPAVHELTLKEIEEKLGYIVKIVSEKKEDE